MKTYLLCTAAVALSVGLWPAPIRSATAPADGVKVVVEGLRDNRGRVGCGLFKGPDGFPRDGTKEFRRMWAAKHANRADCDFTGIPAGTYAVTVLDDTDDDGRMDFNLIGLPKKGYGFSNDARATLMAPSFEAASFSYSGRGALVVPIEIVYRVP